MTSQEIMYQLKELRDAWKKQNFKFTKEQQFNYDALMKMRRERIFNR